MYCMHNLILQYLDLHMLPSHTGSAPTGSVGSMGIIVDIPVHELWKRGPQGGRFTKINQGLKYEPLFRRIPCQG